MSAVEVRGREMKFCGEENLPGITRSGEVRRVPGESPPITYRPCRKERHISTPSTLIITFARYQKNEFVRNDMANDYVSCWNRRDLVINSIACPELVRRVLHDLFMLAML